MRRREFISGLAAGAALQLTGCADPNRYSKADARYLDEQKLAEREASGTGPHGVQRYAGYRGLSELPWFDLDEAGRLICTADLPPILDIHAHLGITQLFAGEPDLLAKTDRVIHILDADGREPPIPLDLDVYINANFREEDLSALRRGALKSMFTVPAEVATHTIPNLLAEMDTMKVQQAIILPVAFGHPFGDDIAERFLAALEDANVPDRLIPGAAAHYRDGRAVEKLERHAAAGARMVKMHPPIGRFYPDDERNDPIYAACERLGLPVFFHGGRAGIELESMHRYALMRHYERALQRFRGVQFVLGHSGARDVEDALLLAERHPNLWYDLHGQGVTVLDRMVRKLDPDRLMFGTDWPFYHLGATLAKILLVTEDRPELRPGILRGNAARLLGLPEIS